MLLFFYQFSFVHFSSLLSMKVYFTINGSTVVFWFKQGVGKSLNKKSCLNQSLFNLIFYFGRVKSCLNQKTTVHIMTWIMIKRAAYFIYNLHVISSNNLIVIIQRNYVVHISLRKNSLLPTIIRGDNSKKKFGASQKLCL